MIRECVDWSHFAKGLIFLMNIKWTSVIFCKKEREKIASVKKKVQQQTTPQHSKLQNCASSKILQRVSTYIYIYSRGGNNGIRIREGLFIYAGAKKGGWSWFSQSQICWESVYVWFLKIKIYEYYIRNNRSREVLCWCFFLSLYHTHTHNHFPFCWYELYTLGNVLYKWQKFLAYWREGGYRFQFFSFKKKKKDMQATFTHIFIIRNICVFQKSKKS